MFYIDDIVLKPNTTTRVTIDYWSEGYGRGPIVSVVGTVRRQLPVVEGRQSWLIQLEGKDTPSTIREVVLDHDRIELILEL